MTAGILGGNGSHILKKRHAPQNKSRCPCVADRERASAIAGAGEGIRPGRRFRFVSEEAVVSGGQFVLAGEAHRKHSAEGGRKNTPR